MNLNLKLAFLYNVRNAYPDPNYPGSQLEADFDSPETIQKIIEHLSNCGYDVYPIEANQDAYLKLCEKKDVIDIAFNYSEGLHGNDREAHIPAILEMLQIPYTGSSPLTQAIVLNKIITKDLLRSHNIPTLPHQLIKSPNEALNVFLEFPLIIKPVSEGSSAGITNKSVVYSKDQLFAQVENTLSTFNKPVMVESFVDGREFSVSMIGNPPRILPIIEPNHSMLPTGYQKIDSLEVKWFYEEDSSVVDYLICPADIEPKLKDQVEYICLKTWEILNIKDFCRIDLRCDSLNNPYILEVNSPPGLIPPEISTTSYFPLAARNSGIGYDSLLELIIDSALERINSQKN